MALLTVDSAYVLSSAGGSIPTSDVMLRSGGLLNPVDVSPKGTGTAAGGTKVAQVKVAFFAKP